MNSIKILSVTTFLLMSATVFAGAGNVTSGGVGAGASGSSSSSSDSSGGVSSSTPSNTRNSDSSKEPKSKAEKLHYDRRTIWRGYITFGLVNIPVMLYSAEKPQQEIHFKLLDKKVCWHSLFKD